MLTQDHWQQALDVQDACNLSGVVHSFAAITNALWDEANAKGLGTAFVNEHPISVLFANKIAALAGAESYTRYHEAYNITTLKILYKEWTP